MQIVGLLSPLVLKGIFFSLCRLILQLTFQLSMNKSKYPVFLAIFFLCLTRVLPSFSQAQAIRTPVDTIQQVQDSLLKLPLVQDTVLRIRNLSPFFTLH